MNDKIEYLLGETNKEFLCISEEENQQVACALLQQAELKVDIFSRDFEPAVYDNPTCRDAIEDLALRNRHSRIRILLHDPRKVSQRGHHILYLGRRLGSLMQLRAVAEVHQSIRETFLLVDGIGFMHRPHADTLAATVNFKDAPRVKELTKLFEKIWKEAEPDPHFRHLVL